MEKLNIDSDSINKIMDLIIRKLIGMAVMVIIVE